MMTREMVLELLATAESDLSIFEYTNGDISVTVQDFDGFNAAWSEIDRELDNEKLVDSIEEQIASTALSAVGDYYRHYHFDGFTVVWGYASMDI